VIFGALFFYQYHSSRNRLLARLRRLRQPKYLFGAIVGGLYFYFYLFRGLGGARSARATPMAVPAELSDLRETLTALGFMVMVLLAWILPHSRAALAFSEAEVAFLFPAPISRRTLVNFKLLKSQTAIAFSALLMTLIGRGLGGGPLLIRLFGWWAAISIFNLHLLGSSFALTMLMDRGISNWKRRAIFLGGTAAVATAIFLWAWHSLPPAPTASANGFEWLFSFIKQVLDSGPLPYLLAPFRLVVAPYFASNFPEFLKALAPVLAILALHYLWVMRSNVAFEEASVEFSRKLAERISAVRAGNWQGARKPAKVRRPPFTLRPAGRPWVALFWKNLISAGRFVTGRVWLLLVWVAVFGGGFLQSESARGGGGLGMGVIFVVGMLLAMSLVTGPQMLRNDLRQDLPAADILKMLPMPGWQVVLGEVLAPAAMLAGAQWLLILFGAVFFPDQFEHHAIPLAARVSVALAAALVLPLIDLLALMIPNAAVLYFPAWYPLGKDVPRGFETMGQQLILMAGQVMVLAGALLLPAGAFIVIFLCASFLQWPLMGVMLGAIAAAVLLAVEAVLGLKLLGGVFARFDLSGELL
jgi:ABC-2 type transport system permease protein